jgi:hypothetical protein
MQVYPNCAIGPVGKNANLRSSLRAPSERSAWVARFRASSMKKTSVPGSLPVAGAAFRPGVGGEGGAAMDTHTHDFLVTAVATAVTLAAVAIYTIAFISALH